MSRRTLAALLASAVVICTSAACEPGQLDFHGVDDPGVAAVPEGLALADLSGRCSTAGTEGLSAQLLDEMSCLSGGALVRYEHPNIVLTSTRVHPYLSPAGRDALLSVAASSHVEINSGLRTIAEQYVLSRGCSVAAAPGRSNHETGRAIDVANYATVGSALIRAGFTRPLPSSDPVHYEASGDDLRSASVRAFQLLWNANHPEDRIAEDGDAGAQTLTRLARAPASGFAISHVCESRAHPPPSPDAGTTPPRDAGSDAGVTPPRDAGSDAGTTPPRDAGSDAGTAPPPSGAGSCTHSFGGVYGSGACSESYQCCDGAWFTRSGGGCGACTCIEATGATGCTAAPPPPPPPPPPGRSCTHSFGGVYGSGACSASYQCCDGTWLTRSSGGCGTCTCVESTGSTGCAG